jgi:hypothetical protein
MFAMITERRANAVRPTKNGMFVISMSLMKQSELLKKLRAASLLVKKKARRKN